MRGLAAYILRGPLQAISAATGFAILALLFMPLSWPLGYISGAAVALVVLAKGLKQGSIVMGGGTLMIGVMFGLMLGQSSIGVAYVLMNWLPMFLVAAILLYSRSLSMSVLIVGVLGLVAILLVYGYVHDPAAWWYDYYMQKVLPLLKTAGVELPPEAEFAEQIKHLTHLMTGSLVGFIVLGQMVSLLIARSWQSFIYRPGAYRDEFYRLRLGRAASLLALMMMLLATWGSAVLAEVAGNFLPVVMVVFLLQGLAVTHNLLGRKDKSKPWLVAMYVGLIVTMPYLLMVIATVGMLDNWMDLRRKLQTES